MWKFISQAHERKKRVGFKTHTALTTLKEQNERRTLKMESIEDEHGRSMPLIGGI